MVSIPLSGTQHTLRAGDYEAHIAGVGASLRRLTFKGRDLVVPFDANEIRPAFRGATLAPWPNRVVDGVYNFGGAKHELALTEPKRGHALHGLAAWTEYVAIDKGSDHVTLSATIEAQVGYPWRVRIETTYSLGVDGLTQSVSAFNESADDAPFGTGPHPYLVAGPGSLNEWVFELAASEVLEVTADRLAPVGLVTVDAAGFDYRAARALGATEIDHAFTGLSADADGYTTAKLTDPSGTGVVMVWDSVCPWVQVHTADQPGGPGTVGHRAGLAVEPMTCAPDAFNADNYAWDAGLLVVKPGAQTTASWRIAAA